VYISSSSATGLMEAAIRNGSRERVLALVNGAFAERFAHIARACGREVETLECPWGEAHDPAAVAAALQAGRFDAVTVVHSETSTGALNPIADLARVVHAAGDVMLLVDSVTGVAGAPVKTDEWELDFVFTGSQKALALPPGLALGVARTALLERAETLPARGVYYDLIEFDRYLAKNQTPNTPALSLMYALAAQLDAIMGEGIEARWARHAAMAERTWRWVEEMTHAGVALSVLAPAGARSPTVTCIRLPEGHTGPDVAAAMKQRGWTIGSGYGKLRDTTIRVGHMGDHTLEGLEMLLEELAAVLRP
ncbi:MAG: aminotransferase class V-fold PLP-dependent enzyme, partial [Gemmatimonadota bacterium]|nr:aminotransferase class V-fold PLP-dependent enzyme [Gemmatimonadota bacterium]